MNDYISNHHPATHHAGEYITHPEGRPVSFETVTVNQILDSRGWPTLEVHLQLAGGTIVSGSAPAGASTGAHEAAELRDGGTSFGGRGVTKALRSVSDEIAPLLLESGWLNISQLDAELARLDGTPNWSRLGANAVVATSIAAARAFAAEQELPLYKWISAVTHTTASLPVPHFNVLNGGAHAANPLDFQEFMIAPVGATSEVEAVEMGSTVYHALAGLVKTQFGTAGLGDEGGFAPNIASPEEALDLLVKAIREAGYEPATDQVAIALDPAANSFRNTDGTYRIGDRNLSRTEMVDYYERLLDTYPIRSIEDGFHEDDHDGWAELFLRVGHRTQLVGDDLYVTDAARIRDGGEERYSNAALIKPNQAGTVSQTFDAIAAARHQEMASMVSHRSGETTDTFIADLAVGTGVGQIKSGAPARGERVAKYNRLTDIETADSTLPYGLV